MTSSPRPQAPHGMTVGGYTLLTRIGEGGMGVVHLARKPGGERVALKVLRPHIVGDDEARSRLAREVSSLSRIHSRWVAEIVDADPWGDIPFVATRYVPGLSLHDHVLEEGPIAGADLTWFARCLAEGVASVHDVGVLHRDIKPSNVLMEGRTPILIDFGLARVADDPKLTHTGWLLGTPGYLPPEILYGDDATPATDVHSWAATVVYAGTGRSPYGRGPSMAIMDRVRRGEHDLEGIPDDLYGLVTAALDPEPARRPSLDDLLDRLRPEATRVRRIAPRAEPDPGTMPLSLAGLFGLDEPTDRFPEHDDDRADTRAVPVDPGDPFAPPARTTLPQRLRRVVLLAGAGLTAGAAVAAFPWLAVAVLVLGTWLLRSGSLAVSAHGNRRRLRGRKWYDGVLLLLGAPWDLVRSIPGTLLLALWAVGLAIAGALIGYAASAGPGLILFVVGTVFAASLAAGPGGSRVRGPLARAATPLAIRPGPWLVAAAALAVVAGVLGWSFSVHGSTWTPAEQAPWHGVTVPHGPLGL